MRPVRSPRPQPVRGAAVSDPFHLAPPPPDEEASPRKRRRPAVFPAVPARKPRYSGAIAARALALLDWAILAGAAWLAAKWALTPNPAQLSLGQAGALLAAYLPLKVGLWSVSAYEPRARGDHGERALGGAALGAMASLATCAMAAPTAQAASALTIHAGVAAILIVGVHALTAAALRARAIRRGSAETAILAGDAPAAVRAVARAQALGAVAVVAAVKDRRPRGPAELAGAPVAGDLDDLLAWRDLPNIDRLFVAIDSGDDAASQARLDKLAPIADRLDVLIDAAAATNGAKDAVALLPARAPDITRIIVKRGLDIAVSAALLALTAPLFALVWSAIRLESRGPGLVRAHRRGADGQVIVLHAFRTHYGAQGQGPAPANDGARTFMGHVIARTPLNLLPRLADVLRGALSLVGPAPEPMGGWRDLASARLALSRYALRHGFKAGLANPGRTPGVKDAAALIEDARYMAHASLWLDAWLFVSAPLRRPKAKQARRGAGLAG